MDSGFHRQGGHLMLDFSCDGWMRVVLIIGLSMSIPVNADDIGKSPESAPVIRVWGNPAMGHLMQMWQEAFARQHPEVSFEYDLRSTALGMPALTTGVADLVLLGRRPRVIEVSQFEFEHRRLPVIVEVAGGAYDIEGKSWPLMIYVHRDNPIRALTMQQLDFIFGARRSGGWNRQGTRWLASAARGKQSNIRNWGQLGLGGHWQHQRIIPYGFDIHSNSTAIAFSELVFNGGDMWNEALEEVVAVPGDRTRAGERVAELLAKNRFGIAIAGVQHANDGIRPVAISREEGAEYVVPTKEAVMRRDWPLVRSVYVAFDDHPGNPQRELLREFVAFILGDQGQEQVAREGGYLPLPVSVAQDEMKKVFRD